MPTPLSPTKLMKCDGCQAVLPIGTAKPGQKCRCGRCGKVLIVPGGRAKRSQPVAQPQPLGFNCLLCNTRITVQTSDVGRKARCPDCGRVNVVPQPPKPKPKQTPAAMHGQQYELWDAGKAPDNAELLAKQPKFFPVYCRVCNTLMHAQASQVGSLLSCPDCGGQTKVPAPPIERERAKVIVEDGEEYQLDEAQSLPERPDYVPFEVRQMEERQQYEKKLEEREYEDVTLPSNPLIEGVWSMLGRTPLPGSIFALSFGLLLEAWFLANAMANVKGLALMVVLLAYGTTSVFGMLILLGASAMWLAVLKESAEGNNKLYDPPGLMFLDWVGGSFYVVFSTAVAIAPGMLAWRFVPNLPPWAGPVAAAASWLTLFPVVLLSQLENGSPLEIFSPRLGGSLLKCPGPWMLFYFESVLILGGCAGAVLGLQLTSPWLVVVSVGLIALTSFLYFRLLGRLAWWIAELMPAEEG